MGGARNKTLPVVVVVLDDEDEAVEYIKSAHAFVLAFAEIVALLQPGVVVEAMDSCRVRTLRMLRRGVCTCSGVVGRCRGAFVVLDVDRAMEGNSLVKVVMRLIVLVDSMVSFSASCSSRGKEHDDDDVAEESVAARGGIVVGSLHCL